MNSSHSFPTEIINLDENTIDEKSPRKSLKEYASKVFQESTIGILASIVSTSSKTRKVFKTFVLLSCLTGFLYQCITFMAVFFQYPTTVDIIIQRPEKFITPAFTFCSNNGMKRSVFCSKYPKRCTEPSENFCSNFHHYCGKNKTLIPKKEFYNLEESLTYEEILDMGDNLNEFVTYNWNLDNENISGPYIRTKDMLEGSMICYSLHSVVNSTEYAKEKRKSNSLMSAASNKLQFYVENEDMFIPGNRPGVLFSIHSPFEAVNPFKKGIFMKAGRTYKIFVTIMQEVLLEDPFATDCMNYEEIWEANNRTGPRIQEMCVHKCMLDLSLKCFHCAAAFIMYPSKARICSQDEFQVECTDEEYSTFFECMESCKDDCKVTKYTPSVMERYEVEYDEETGIDKNYDRHVTVEIYIEDSEIITLRHSPKYMTVEVFSSIGGFIGCWLGISLMDIIDVFASSFMVTRYALKKSGN